MYHYVSDPLCIGDADDYVMNLMVATHRGCLGIMVIQRLSVCIDHCVKKCKFGW